MNVPDRHAPHGESNKQNKKSMRERGRHKTLQSGTRHTWNDFNYVSIQTV